MGFAVEGSCDDSQNSINAHGAAASSTQQLSFPPTRAYTPQELEAVPFQQQVEEATRQSLLLCSSADGNAAGATTDTTFHNSNTPYISNDNKPHTTIESTSKPEGASTYIDKVIHASLEDEARRKRNGVLSDDDRAAQRRLVAASLAVEEVPHPQVSSTFAYILKANISDELNLRRWTPTPGSLINGMCSLSNDTTSNKKQPDDIFTVADKKYDSSAMVDDSTVGVRSGPYPRTTRQQCEVMGASADDATPLALNRHPTANTSEDTYSAVGASANYTPSIEPMPLVNVDGHQLLFPSSSSASPIVCDDSSSVPASEGVYAGAPRHLSSDILLSLEQQPPRCWGSPIAGDLSNVAVVDSASDQCSAISSAATTAAGSEPGSSVRASSGLLVEMLTILFGADLNNSCVPTVKDMLRWLQQPFSFNTNPYASWGLSQVQGGPCGVLVALQSWLLRQIMFSSTEPRAVNPTLIQELQRRCRLTGPFSAAMGNTADREMQIAHTTSDAPCGVSGAPPHVVRASMRLHTEKDVLWMSLAEALGCALYQCTALSVYQVALLREKDESDLLIERGQSASSTPASSVIAIAPSLFHLDTWQFSNIQDVVAFYFVHRRLLLRSPAAVLSAVMSVILTRGLKKVRDDTDESGSVSLIGYFGHSTQALVNLFLTGRASSNVFDGNKKLSDSSDDGMELKGIARPQLLGYLSEHEVLRLCDVGNYFKRPRYPIWVVASPNHYTTLFCLDIRVTTMSEKDIIEMKVQQAFNDLGADENQFVVGTHLHSLIARVGLQEHTRDAERRLGPPVSEHVILRSDFLAWAEDIRLKFNTPTKTEHEMPKTFIVYHYDGQNQPASVAETHMPVTRYLVELLDNPTVQGDDFENPLSSGMRQLLRTLWPNCLVSSLPVASSPLDPNVLLCAVTGGTTIATVSV
eukprot:Lankesteria_metandrocarpae@DN4927_c0_g1_i2.p1